VSIDSDGCPTRLTLRIKFDNNSSLVAPEYRDELATAAQCINDYPGNEVLIYGHTDSKGAAEYNQKLSEKRASAVRNSLIAQFAIAEKKLKIRGFGEDLPVADNETSEGRALNRRVEVLCGAAK
jgi:OOP family OmpA-OmpF porin